MRPSTRKRNILYHISRQRTLVAPRIPKNPGETPQRSFHRARTPAPCALSLHAAREAQKCFEGCRRMGRTAGDEESRLGQRARRTVFHLG